MLKYRPSPSLVIALLALFVALGGTAVALRAGSVGPKALKQNAVRSKHVKNEALKGVDIREATLNGIVTTADRVDAACDPSDTPVLCDGATITLDRTQNVVVLVTGTWEFLDALNDPVHGNCRLVRDGTSITGEQQIGTLADDTSPQAHTLAIVARDEGVGAGPRTYSLSCDEDLGDDMRLEEVSTVVIAVGTG